MDKFCKLLIIPICLYASVLHSHPSAAPVFVTPAQKKAVTSAIEKLSKEAGKKLTIDSINGTPIPGILQVIADLNVFYASTDGEFLIFGEIIDLNKSKETWSLTEQTMRKLRVEALAKVKEKDMIIYPATGKKLSTITVFTDIDCPYCRKMQDMIGDYNAAGIEVRYLAFPRSGPDTKSFEEAIKVWCAADKPKAYNKAVENGEFPKKTCDNKVVIKQYELGRKLGVTGTPTIILENGIKIGGLVEPNNLVKIIKESGNS